MPFAEVAKLAEAAGAPLHWLATGEATSKEIVATMDGAGEFVLLPKYDVRASAGGGLVPLSDEPPERIAFGRDWLAQFRGASKNLGLLTADGDSMYPTIPNGALMLVDFDATRPLDGAIFVFEIDGAMLVKRLQVRFDKSLVLISDNATHYPPQTITGEAGRDFAIRGRVLWIGRPL